MKGRLNNGMNLTAATQPQVMHGVGRQIGRPELDGKNSP